MEKKLAIDNVMTDQQLQMYRFNKNNAGQDLVSIMFSSVLSTSPIIDKFSSWLVAGTGAVAAIFITQARDMLPFF